MVQPLQPSQPLAAAEGPRSVESACPLDCPDACSLTVEVAGGRVVKLDGSHRNPFTDGFICAKVRRWPELMYGEGRLTHPAVRRGRKGEGSFERVSWDEAFDLVVGRMREARERFGGESILPFYYGGSNGLLTQGTTDARLFARLGASRLARTVCAAPSGSAATGLYGKMPGVALPDFRHARLIVLWGVNPSASGIHLVPVILEAQRQGARLVVVDPRRTPLAKKADLHLAPRPGTDLVVALAAIRWLFEEGRADLGFLAAHTHGAAELRRRAAPWEPARAAAVSGIAAAELERFFRLYADSSPAVIRAGWGIERNRNGGSAVAATLALPAVAGKFGVRGGGYTLSNSGAWAFDDAAAAALAPAEAGAATRILNMNRLGEALLEWDRPPIQVLFVYNCNPLATLPEQGRVRRGLERDDLFTVVYDPVATDTARYADLVLPATTFLEHHELSRGYGSLVAHRSAPVVEPVGEARPNYEVFGELCRRLGLERPGDPHGAAELTSALLRRSPRVGAELEQAGIANPDCGESPVQFVDNFPRTRDRKVDLVPEALDREAPRGLYTYQEDPATALYPLALISPATSRTVSSILGHLHRKQVALEIHPEDAARRGIGEGAAVRIWNELGEVLTAARLNPDLAAGVVLLPKGLWSHNTRSGSTANALVPATAADLGGGACFNDARVEVALEDGGGGDWGAGAVGSAGAAAH
ncbi:MAG TPA: molybdopterin-dependent oxidoreductase [Thermoanaerobaculia bacterium]|nr:molybdopterin-dependent oxidoreductase [Thermoanaerobaculia bacterium]